MAELELLRKGWPFLIIGALVIVVLYFRSENIALSAQSAAQVATISNLQTINANNEKTMELERQAKASNDAIQQALTTSLGTIETGSATTQAVIKKVYINDPSSHNWASVPLPDGVRNALNVQAN